MCEFADIEHEFNGYEKYFRGKHVLCQCDAAINSNFFKYFALRFVELGLKKLTAITYADSRTAAGYGHGYYITLDSVDADEEGLVSWDSIQDKIIDGTIAVNDIYDGYFDSDECLKMLKSADLVVASSPFMLITPYDEFVSRCGKPLLVYNDPDLRMYYNMRLSIHNGIFEEVASGDNSWLLEPRK